MFEELSLYRGKMQISISYLSLDLYNMSMLASKNNNNNLVSCNKRLLYNLLCYWGSFCLDIALVYPKYYKLYLYS